MNYEKKYNDLVEKLKKAASDPEWEDERFCCVINEHFSELKESEDEEIRKYLTSFVELNSGVNLLPEKSKKILAWLERQREQKPTWKPSGEQMKYLLKFAEQNNYDGRILTSLYNDLKKIK